MVKNESMDASSSWGLFRHSKSVTTNIWKVYLTEDDPTQCFLVRDGLFPTFIRTGLLEQAKSASVSTICEKFARYSSGALTMLSELQHHFFTIQQ